MKKIIFTIIFCSTLIYGDYIQNDTTFTNIITEDVWFISEDDTLAGTIVLPDTSILCPAIVMIHGSGKATRNIPYAKKIAKRGLAVLTYDKRGCGKSGGEYEGNLNVSTGNLELLASDAQAALQVLANNSRIDKKRIGTWGISQAGWISPIVASKSKFVSFMVMLSCPTVTVVQELKYSDLAENNPNVFEEYTQEEINDHMNSWSLSNIYFAIVGFNQDPVDYLKQLKIPVLWIYGDVDRSIPAQKSIEILQRLDNNKFEIKSYPNYGHSLKSPFGKDSPSMEVNEYFVNWVLNLPSK
jgi:dienelactone hydrolase